jgi:pyrroline-5-carboxylate reductase
MNIGILGTGNMGKALIGGMLKAYGVDVHLVAFDLKKEAMKSLDTKVLIAGLDTWAKKGLDAVVIAVKPADMEQALSECRRIIGKKAKGPLWISIAAGKSIGWIAKRLSPSSRIVRVMPNTPALIGEGISAYAMNENCGNSDAEKVEYVLKACGKTVQVPEKLLDAVTGLSGSGPAYVYLFIEALIDGGVTAGLPYHVARELALQTVIGAASMIEQEGENPAVLRSRVMSPGGTTASGLNALEKNAFRHAVIEAVVAATKRSSELGA